MQDQKVTDKTNQTLVTAESVSVEVFAETRWADNTSKGVQ